MSSSDGIECATLERWVQSLRKPFSANKPLKPTKLEWEGMAYKKCETILAFTLPTCVFHSAMLFFSINRSVFRARVRCKSYPPTLDRTNIPIVYHPLGAYAIRYRMNSRVAADRFAELCRMACCVYQCGSRSG